MHPEKINKYLYINKTPTWLVKFIYIIGATTWLGVIYGYSKFLNFNPTFFWVIFPLISFLIFYHLLSYIIIIFYKQFDLKKHKIFIDNYDIKKLSINGEYPLVDVFLPICGEDSWVLEKTFSAVSKLKYPNINVYVLDDRGIQDHKELAEKNGFKYFCRENKGHMKKAGNLKHGYERSTGEFIVIYDADFAPHPDFINELLPYMDDPKVGIIQSPQYFQTDKDVHKRSPLEYGASHVQEDFYRFIQVARSRWGAPICCGSNAIYRRKALDTIGGTVQIEHSEDAYTGFELTNKGYIVKYIPIILAVGLCPSDLHSYFHQQHRWCSGSMSLMLNKQFWKSNLNIKQKLCFIAGFMYYLSHPITVILSFQIFFLFFFFSSSVQLYNALPFIPCILFSFLVIPMFRITRGKYGGFLARNSYLYSYSHAIIIAFIRQSVGWHPTNTKSIDVSRAYKEQLFFGSMYFLTYTFLVVFSVGAGLINILNINSYSLLFWIFYNVISTSLIICNLYFLIYKLKKQQLENRTISKKFFYGWFMKTFVLYIFAMITLYAIALPSGRFVENKYFTKNGIRTNLQDELILASDLFKEYDKSEVGLDSDNLLIEDINFKYSIPLEYKDGKTNIARKAIKMYLDESSLVLTRKQLIFAEDSLQKELTNIPKKYSKDINISVSREKVEFHVNKTLNSALVKEN